MKFEIIQEINHSSVDNFFTLKFEIILIIIIIIIVYKQSDHLQSHT